MKEIKWAMNPQTSQAHLYYRDDSTKGMWSSYKTHPLAASNYQIPGGSDGYRTMQLLLKAGYVYYKTDGVEIDP